MSFDEILEELPKLTTEEKKRLRELLDSELSWTEEEEQAIEEGLRSLPGPEEKGLDREGLPAGKRPVPAGRTHVQPGPRDLERDPRDPGKAGKRQDNSVLLAQPVRGKGGRYQRDPHPRRQDRLLWEDLRAPLESLPRGLPVHVRSF